MCLRTNSAALLLLTLAACVAPALSVDLHNCTEPRSCYDTKDCVMEVKKTVKINPGQCIKLIEWFPLPWDNDYVKSWPCGNLYPVGVTVSACEHPFVSGHDEVKCTEAGVSVHRFDVTPKCPDYEGTVYVTYCCA